MNETKHDTYTKLTTHEALLFSITLWDQINNIKITIIGIILRNLLPCKKKITTRQCDLSKALYVHERKRKRKP